MEFYGASKPLYLEMGTSGMGHRAGLLQMQEFMNSWHDEVLDNVAFQPIAFSVKV